MKLPKLTAVIEREGKWFNAFCPELGVASQGSTLLDAETMLKDAIRALLEHADEGELRHRLNRGVKVTQIDLANA